MDLVDIATIASSVTALIGLVIQYISFKKQITQINITVSTLEATIQLHQQMNNPTTQQFINCNITNSPLNANQVQNEYNKENIGDSK